MDMLDQKNVMNRLNSEELKKIDGGTITGALVSAFESTLKTIFDFGKSLGTSLRRINEDKMCKIS